MRLARVLRNLGEVLITLGLVVLLFVGYELWFTGLQTSRDQRSLRTELRETWGSGTATALKNVPIGDGLAVLHVPRFGRDWAKVVVEGVSRTDLQKGPGHYPGTQLPGEVGNFVVSGHRTTYGAPFGRVDELRPGDPVVVETRDMWFTYAVRSTQIVRPTAIEVTYPVPGQREATAKEAILTLTSCHPKLSARQRIVVYGSLVSSLAKSAGLAPPALT